MVCQSVENMLTFRYSVFFVFHVFLPDKVRLLDNGLARTPPMGWMSWGYYECAVNCDETPDKCLNEKLILSVVDSFFMEGYQEAGYEYIIIDDCWSEKHRNRTGHLVPDKKRFPRGMKFIADYIHKRGLKFGMYTNIASTTCMGYPGSRDNFPIDAKSFAEWEIDYLKVDGCFVGENYLNVAYIQLGEQLAKTGRPMVYSCSWPYYIEFIIKKNPNHGLVAKHCNLWRNYHDVKPLWGNVYYTIKYFEQHYNTISKHHKPGQWNDPDMLLFGQDAITIGQRRIQLAVYAVLSAPLLLSCDMNKITPYEKKMLLNLDLIAIAQDPLGIMAQPHLIRKEMTIWVKRHLPAKGDVYHSFSFALVNYSPENETVSFVPVDYGPNSPDGYTVMDVFTGEFLRNITIHDPIHLRIPPEDVILYTMYPL